MAPHGSHAAARNSPAEHTADAEKIFCCVTTRRRAEPLRSAAASEYAGDALVPPRRASDAPRAQPADPAAASSLAIDARPADNPDLGSSAGSTAGRGRTAHSPWPGKAAIPVAPPWSNHPRRRYAAHGPWEVTAPLGQPGEDVCASSLGTYPLVLGPIFNRPPATAFPHAASLRQRARDTQEGGYDAPH